MSTESTQDQFVVRIWCIDCGDGKDPSGCFDGGFEMCMAIGPPYGMEIFSSEKDAHARGRMEMYNCDLFRYSVERLEREEDEH